jgi:hypothetical protein
VRGAERERETERTTVERGKHIKKKKRLPQGRFVWREGRERRRRRRRGGLSDLDPQLSNIQRNFGFDPNRLGTQQ